MRAFGKYRLLEPIASGGMAEVWRAEVPGAAGFVKEVALKLIRGDHDARGEFVDMFIREARLASRLAHGNIVQVFDFDQVDGRYYIAMELVRGRTLRDAVDRCRALGVRFGLARGVHVGAEIARALAYAHRAEHGGLVHRDVSPQNVLLSWEGDVKLADFGIARVLGTGDVTSPGTVKGKLAYMAPEQGRGGAVDARADVFSLGVVLWELCAGRRLFARDSDAATLAAVMAGDPIVPPSAWNESVPPELDAILLGALARDPHARTASAEALASALAAMRLRLAVSPEDLDVRSLLARLWPDRDDTPSRGEPCRTEVRTPGGGPAPSLVRASPATPALVLPRVAEDEAPVPPPPALPPPEPITRTSIASAQRRRSRRRAGGIVAVTSAVAFGIAGAHLWARTVGRSDGSRTAPGGSAVAGPSHPTTAATPDQGPVASGAATSPPAGAPAAPPARSVERASPAGPPAAPPARSVERASPDPVVGAVSRPGGAAAGDDARAPRPAGGERHAGASGAIGSAPGRPPAAPRGADGARGLASAESAETATVSVRALPWAWVRIDGEDVGETPFEAAVSARPHRIAVHHPTLGEEEIVVTLRPGERYVWQPRLARP